MMHRSNTASFYPTSSVRATIFSFFQYLQQLRATKECGGGHHRFADSYPPAGYHRAQGNRLGLPLGHGKTLGTMS